MLYDQACASVHNLATPTCTQRGTSRLSVSHAIHIPTLAQYNAAADYIMHSRGMHSL